jgi:hypothetical protein
VVSSFGQVKPKTLKLVSVASPTIHLGIHWPFYFTVNVHVIHYFVGDSMCSFRMKAKLCRFFYCLFIFVLSLESYFPFQINPNTYLCLSQARIWISNAIFRGLFFVCSKSCTMWEFVDHHCCNFLFILLKIGHDVIYHWWTRHSNGYIVFLFNMTSY